MKSNVSVIVCTAHRLDSVEDCLQSLVNQFGRNFEVIVVDGRKDEKLAGVCSALAKKMSLKRVIIKQESLPLARNIGIAKSKYSLIAFIDDDALSDPYWIHNICVFFKDNPGVSILGGKVTALQRNYLSMFAEKIFYFGDRKTVVPVVLGVNMILNMKTIATLSPKIRKPLFKNELTTAGDDTELSLYIRSLGGQIVYDPYVCVKHQYRSSLINFLIRTSQYAYGDTIVLTEPAYRSYSFMEKYILIFSMKENFISKFINAIELVALNVFSFVRRYGLIWLPLTILREIAYCYGVYKALKEKKI